MPDDKKEVIKTPKPETASAAGKRFVFTDNDVTIALESPIVLGNGEQTIDHINLRKPRAGAMRGLSMFEIMHMDTDTIVKLLPRITTPIIHKVMAEELDPADLANIGKCLAGFFSGKKQRSELIAEMEAESK